MVIEAYSERRLSPLRRVIAARMSEAKRTIPHYRVTAQVEVDELLRRRSAANKARVSDKATVNDVIVKACATALVAHPQVNVQVVGDKVRTFADANISVVTAVEGGLSTPVVRAANRKSIWEISQEVRDFAQRASAGRLRMDEIEGGSFSVSNLGAYGADAFDAIINPPQAAILAIGAARPLPVARPSGAVVVANVLQLTLSVDHRVIDGAVAAIFAGALRALLEDPADLFQ